MKWWKQAIDEEKTFARCWLLPTILFVVLWMGPRALCLLSKHSYHWVTSQVQACRHSIFLCIEQSEAKYVFDFLLQLIDISVQMPPQRIPFQTACWLCRHYFPFFPCFVSIALIMLTLCNLFALLFIVCLFVRNHPLESEGFVSLAAISFGSQIMSTT